MWKLIYKYAFVLVCGLGIIVYPLLIAKGEYMEKRTPIGNAINWVWEILLLIGFYMWYWDC